MDGDGPRLGGWVGPLLLAVAGTLASLAVAAQVPWLGDRPATCRPTGCFCELSSTSAFVQPVNALTSLAFVVGAGLVARRRLDLVGPAERRLAAWLVAILVVIGFGSYGYHATLTFTGQVLDVLGMCLLGLLLVIGGQWRRDHLSTASACALGIGFAGLVVVLLYAVPDLRRWLFAAILLPGILLESRPRPSRPLLVGVALMAIGYAVWLAERVLPCDPSGVLQGHAVWHLLTAAAAYQLMRHYAATSPAQSVTATATRAPSTL